MIEKVHRAGTLPYIWKDGEPVFLFQIPSDTRYGGPDPQFSKGKIEEGEDASSAAFRESVEELGLKMENVKIETVYEIGVRLGRTTLYMFEVYDPEDFDEPDYETAATVWMNWEEFRYKGRDIHRDIVREAREILLEERM